ncbi:MAG: hypothetical protein U0232_04915 [Thermomicrobiales bacterium]
MNNANAISASWTVASPTTPGALGERLTYSWYVDALTGEVIAGTGGG